MTDIHARQNTFLHNIANLIHFIQDSGYTISGGELWRSEETQAHYVEQGLSQTMNSLHLKRLAIDLNILDNDYLLFTDTTRKEKDLQIVTEFGRQWMIYDKENIWGGTFKTLFDPFHFQMNDK